MSFVIASAAPSTVPSILARGRSRSARASAQATKRACPTAKSALLSTSSRRESSSVTRALPLAELALEIDTTQFDQTFLTGLRIGLPLYGAIVGAIFIFGTIAKVAFPQKYDAAVYGAEAKREVEKGKIDLDNLSEEDAKAVAELEAELRAQGKL